MQKKNFFDPRIEFLSRNFAAHDDNGTSVWTAGLPCPLHAVLLAFASRPEFRLELRGHSVRFFVSKRWYVVPVAQCSPQSAGFLGDYLRGQQEGVLSAFLVAVNHQFEIGPTSEQESSDAHPQVH